MQLRLSAIIMVASDPAPDPAAAPYASSSSTLPDAPYGMYLKVSCGMTDLTMVAARINLL